MRDDAGHKAPNLKSNQPSAGRLEDAIDILDNQAASRLIDAVFELDDAGTTVGPSDTRRQFVEQIMRETYNNAAIDDPNVQQSLDEAFERLEHSYFKNLHESWSSAQSKNKSTEWQNNSTLNTG